MGFLFENKSSMLFLLGVILMIAILMRRWNRYYQRQKKAKPKVHPRAARDANREQPLMDAPPELLRWQVEMHDIARDLKGELDTKIAVLQRLVIDAREQADRLESIVTRADNRTPRS